MPSRVARAGFLLVVAAALAGVIWYGTRRPAAPGPVLDPHAWRVGAGALSSAENDPRLRFVAVVLGGVRSYEKDVFSDPDVEPLLDNFVKIRLDLRRDSTLLERYGVAWAPAFLVLTPDGHLVTRREGRFDPAEIARTLRGALAFPVARADLPGASDTTAPAALLTRAAEVALELGEADTALAIAHLGRRRAEQADTSVLPKARFVLAYALASAERFREAAHEAADLAADLDDADDLAPAALWIELAARMGEGGGGAEVTKTLERLLQRFPDSPYARQALLTYALRYLPDQGQSGREAAVAFLRRVAGREAPYASHARLALAGLLARNPETLAEGVAHYRALARESGRVGDEALETLASLAREAALAKTDLLASTILFLQELAVDAPPERALRIRYYLGVLEADAGSPKLAAKDLAAAAADPAQAGPAYLRLGSVRLDALADPSGARAAYEAALASGLEPEARSAAMFGRARALFFEKRWDEAAEALHSLLARDDLPPPVRGEAENLLSRIEATAETKHEDLGRLVDAILLRAEGRNDEALEALESLVAESPESPVAAAALFESARMYDARGDDAKRDEALRRIRDRYPNTEEAALARRLLSR